MNAVLLDSLWIGAFVFAVAALVTLAVPQRHAATRYVVWFAALLALAILPLAGQMHPARAIVDLPPAVQSTAIATGTITAHTATASGAWLGCAWFAGAAFCFLRLVSSFLRIKRLLQHAIPAPHLGEDVMLSHDLAFPIAAGVLSPRIVIPTVIAQTLTSDDLEAVIRHERAHIRRGDLVGNLIQRTIEALLFFNPWVYLIGRQLVKEREAACDDWAVCGVPEPERYATCLARLSQSARGSRTPILTPSAIGSGRMLVHRIARLLNGKVAQLKPNYAVLTASIVLFAALAFVLQTSNVRADAPVQMTPLSNSACWAGVKPIDPPMPDISKADFHPNVEADALVEVGANGKPVSAKIVHSSGYAGIDAQAIKGAMATTYHPEMANCKPVASRYLYKVATGVQN